MSKTLLRSLAGRKPNGLNHWLDAHRGSPRIAWYPSAGDDWRYLLFLSERYQQLYPALHPEPAEPDIYLHTDYLTGDYFNPFANNAFLHDDPRTSIILLYEEFWPVSRLAPEFITRLVEPLRTKALITNRQFELGMTMTVPHFESIKTHEPVDLNSWTVARRRHTVPWSGYEPAKFFMRP